MDGCDHYGSLSNCSNETAHTIYTLKCSHLGRGCGQVVIVLAFYYDGPSSNRAKGYIFSVKAVVETNKNKQKEARVGPLKKYGHTNKSTRLAKRAVVHPQMLE